MSTVFKDYCTHILSHVHPRATFLAVSNYRNNFGEVSNFSVCFHVNYLNLVKKSLAIVEKYKPKTDMEELARQELISSFNWTLNGYNPLYTCQDTYEPILNKATGCPVPGIKLHKKQDIVHIEGTKIRKNIVSEGVYPVHNSSDKTLAKRKIRALTPLKDWVQFKLEPGRFTFLSVQKMKLKGKI